MLLRITNGKIGRIYKCLGKDRRATMGQGSWPEIGVWTKKTKPVLCQSGWHLANDHHVLRWLSEELYIAQPHWRSIERVGNNKFVVSRARLVERVETWNQNNAERFVAALNAKGKELGLLGLQDVSYPWHVAASDTAEVFARHYRNKMCVKHPDGLLGCPRVDKHADLEEEGLKVAYAIFEEIVFGPQVAP